jgi:hypothetical protein
MPPHSLRLSREKCTFLGIGLECCYCRYPAMRQVLKWVAPSLRTSTVRQSLLPLRSSTGNRPMSETKKPGHAGLVGWRFLASISSWCRYLLSLGLDRQGGRRSKTSSLHLAEILPSLHSLSHPPSRQPDLPTLWACAAQGEDTYLSIDGSLCWPQDSQLHVFPYQVSQQGASRPDVSPLALACGQVPTSLRNCKDLRYRSEAPLVGPYFSYTVSHPFARERP